MERRTPVGVRPAALSDLPALLVMMADFNHLEQIPWRENAVEPALRKLLEAPELGAVMLLESVVAPVGYFILTWGYDLEWQGRDAILTELYLRPEQRGRGLSAAALEHVRARALEAGARALHLAVRPENSAALRAYERAGFARVERLLMTQELTSSDRSKL